MSKQYLKINDFSGGMVDAYDSRDLKNNEFSRVENFMLDKRKSLDGMGGERIHQDVPAGDEIVLCPGFGLFVFDSDHDKGTIDFQNAKDDGEHWMAILDALNANIDLFSLSIGSVNSDVVDLGTAKFYKPPLDNGFSQIQVLGPSDTKIVDSCRVTAGLLTITVPNTYGLKVGMFVIGNSNYASGTYSYDGIVDGTKIIDVSSTSITVDIAPVSGAGNVDISLFFSKTLTSDTICTTDELTNFKYPDADGDSDWRFKVGDIVNIDNFSGTGESANAINNVNALRIKSVAPATTGATVNRIINTVDIDFSDVSNWADYSPDSSITFAQSSSSTQNLTITGTNTEVDSVPVQEGAELGYDFIDRGGDLNLLGRKYLVSAVLIHSTDGVADFRFELCGVKSHSFAINNTAKAYSAVLDLSSLSNQNATIDSGLRIYCENTNTASWTIDSVTITTDGSIMTFDEPVLYRTDRVTRYDTVNSTQNETGNIKITLMPKVIYHFADEALRICDTTLTTGTDGPQVRWRGYVKRHQFKDSGTDDVTFANRIINGWKTSDNKLSAPTFLDVVTSSDEDTVPTYDVTKKGAGWAISVLDETDGQDGVIGTWLAGTYEFASTFIYDGIQESPLYAPTTAETTEVTLDNSELTIKVVGSQDSQIGAGLVQYNDRISGGRIYFRETGTDDDWQLFIDIDIIKGIRAKPFGKYTAWGTHTVEAQAIAGPIYSFMPNIDNYESLNGFSQDEDQLHIAGTNEGYRTSVVANRRCFVANVKTAFAYPNLDSDPVQMRDRIMYSPMNRFDTFPRNFFIDVVKGDAEEYVKLEEYADRLLAFKQRRLHIINIQDSTPNNWFLEEIKDFAGIAHHSASVKTGFGVCWVNEEGCFLYDGKSVKNLILNKILESSWEDFITNESSIFYSPKKFYVGVLSDYFGGNSSIYLYDFRTQSWTKGGSALGSNQNRTNYVSDWNGNPVTVFQPLQESWQWNICQPEWDALAPQNNNVIYNWNNLATKKLDPREWSDDYVSKAVGEVVLQTKDYDFGEPGFIKKVYAVTVTYASGNAMTAPISYATDGGTSFTNFTGDFTGSDTATGWKKLRATLSTPVECQSISIKIKNTSPTGTTESLKINDITLEYRIISKRVS